MKQMKYIIGLVVMTVGLLLASCDESLPTSTENPYDTTLLSIKILNGGVDNTVVMEGTINEDKKEISFPRIEPEADFSALKVEASLPEGAVLTQHEFDFSMEDGEAQKTLVLRVQNNTRYKDYLMTVRQKVPVWGADFSDEKVKVYDFSGKVNPMHVDLVAANTRCGDMDGEHVFFASRDVNGPHLLAISDLKKGVINPIKLTPAPIQIWSGRMAHGHIYGVALKEPHKNGILQIYHWDKFNPSADPISLISGDGYDQTALGWNMNGGRLGDYMSLDIDSNGNGFMFLGTNTTGKTVLRLKISGFTTVSEPVLLSPPSAGSWSSYNRVDIDGASDYIYTGSQVEVMAADAQGNISYTLPKSIIPALELVDGRVISFNNKKYFIGSTADGAVSLKVYDVTKATNGASALELIASASPLKTEYTYALGGSITTTARASIIGAYKDNDETLRIMVAATSSGFAICEFPKAVAED